MKSLRRKMHHAIHFVTPHSCKFILQERECSDQRHHAHDDASKAKGSPPSSTSMRALRPRRSATRAIVSGSIRRVSRWPLLDVPRARLRRRLPGRALHAIAITPVSLIRRRPHGLLIDHHGRGVEQAAIRRLIHELQRGARGIALADVVPDVDASDVALASYSRAQSGVVHRLHLRAVFVEQLLGLGFRRVLRDPLLHDLDEVVVPVHVRALDAAHTLHWPGLAAPADGDRLYFALRLHEFGEDGAGAGARSVLEDHDVVGGEGLLRDDVGQVSIAREAMLKAGVCLVREIVAYEVRKGIAMSVDWAVEVRPRAELVVHGIQFIVHVEDRPEVAGQTLPAGIIGIELLGHGLPDIVEEVEGVEVARAPWRHGWEQLLEPVVCENDGATTVTAKVDDELLLAQLCGSGEAFPDDVLKLNFYCWAKGWCGEDSEVFVVLGEIAGDRPITRDGPRLREC